MPKYPKYFILLIVCLFSITVPQTNSMSISIITPTNDITNMYQDQSLNEQFIEHSMVFNCSLNPLYTYKQTQQQNQANTPYTISFINVTSDLTFTINTEYGVFTPVLSADSCTTDCNITIQNYCPQEVSQFAYFDIVQFQVSGITTTFSYNVLCDSSFTTNTFQWGLVIMIVFCTVLLVIVTIYSKAWSMGGNGIRINYWLILAFWVVLAILGLVAFLTTGVIGPIILIGCLILGVAGVWVCSNQIIFLFRIQFLEKSIDIKSLFKIRILDVISLLIGLAIAIGYIFSLKNWIVNDILCVSIIIAVIKIFKFTDLKTAIFALVTTLAVQMTFVLVIHYSKGTSYNDLILNQYNFPFQLQLPTINPVFKQKCAWFPFTAIVYPGIFMSFLRRFDLSRNTNIYFITAVVVFMAGSVVWMFISVGSIHSWPFEIVTGPTMIILVALFAYKRRQIRTLWEGTFYDQDFANRDGLKQIQQSMDQQKRQTELMRISLMKGLKISSRQDSDVSQLKKFSSSAINDSI